MSLHANRDSLKNKKARKIRAFLLMLRLNVIRSVIDSV